MEKMAHLIPFKTSGKIRLNKEILAIIAILLLGLFLRIYNIRDYIVFLGDEGRDALVVYEILHGNLTLLGPTSSVGGFFLGPIYYYMMAPFLFLSNYDPVGPAVMVAIFGVLTIFLVYKIGKEFFDIKTGLIASLLYAISPVVITYSRSSWNPNVFPFFTVLSLYSLYKAVTKNKWWLFFFSGFLMGINLQIHYLATFVGAIMFFYVLFVDFKKSESWIFQTLKRYFLMLGGFMLGFLPFILFELRHQFANTGNILEFVFNSPETGAGAQIIPQIEHVILRLYGGLVFLFPTSLFFPNYDKGILDLWLKMSMLVGMVTIGFFFYYVYKNIKIENNYKKFLLIIVWFIVGIGLFGIYKKSIYDYYLGFLFPLPFLFIGLLFSNIWDRFKIFGKIIVLVSLILIVYINLKYTPIARPGNNLVDQMKNVSLFILSKTNNEPFNFALSGAGNSDHAYRYFFRLSKNDPIRIRGLGEDPGRTSVTRQLFVVCEQVPCSPLGESSNDIAGFGRGEIAEEWDLGVTRIYKIRHYSGNE